MGTTRGRAVMDWLRHSMGIKSYGVYHLPDFWNQRYAQESHRMKEPFEWCGLSLEHLFEYSYSDVSPHREIVDDKAVFRRFWSDDIPFHSRVLMMGSGTSLLGHKMKAAGWNAGITHLDFSEHAIYDKEEGLDWVLGDARHMTFESCFDAVIDKGTVDANYLSSVPQHERDLENISLSAAAALVPKTGKFISFSLSQPKYIWPLLVGPSTADFWDPEPSQVRKIRDVYMYVLHRNARRPSKKHRLSLGSLAKNK